VQKSWINQSINLQTLTEKIVNFLEKEKFDLTVFKEEEGYSIIANNSLKHKIDEDIIIQIYGDPNNLTIKIEEGARKRRFAFSPLLAAMFGGGYFLLRKLKSNEEYIKFTKYFWQNINRILAEIRNDNTIYRKGEG